MTEDGLERYRVISTLGTGGMATVLLAEDLRLSRRVALKQLAGDAALRPGRARESDRTLISRLHREALLGASVSHPNLVSIYDVVSTAEGGLVIVMEYVPGETLRDRMMREGRLPPDDALPILQGIASGLDAIHRRGIVHRDLKPANVLLGDGDTVKLADFGIATGAESTRITSQGAVVGTFRYMAPEQLEDAPSSPAMDIYALAVVALEMLSGERARRESHPIALAHALATQPPPDLRMSWPEAPPAAAEVLLRGMDRDPSVRPRHAGELVGRLRAALEDETTKHPLGSRLANRGRRQRAAAADPSPDGGELDRAGWAAADVVDAVAASAPNRPPGPAPDDVTPAPAAEARAPEERAPEERAPKARAPEARAAPAPAPDAPAPTASGRASAPVMPPRVVPSTARPRSARSRGAAERAAPASTVERSAGRGRRRRLAAPIALLVVLGGVAAAVIATSGPSGSSPGTKVSSVKKHSQHTGAHRPAARHHAPATKSSSETSTSSSSASTTTTSSSPSTTAAGNTGTGAAAGPSAGAGAKATHGTKAPGPGAAGSVASTPVQAVEAFYHEAAAHR